MTMETRNRSEYSRNLLTRHRQFHRVWAICLIPVVVLTLAGVFWGFYRFQKASAFTYVFHTGGASIQIYEPAGTLTGELMAVRSRLKKLPDPVFPVSPVPSRPTVSTAKSTLQ